MVDVQKGFAFRIRTLLLFILFAGLVASVFLQNRRIAAQEQQIASLERTVRLMRMELERSSNLVKRLAGG